MSRYSINIALKGQHWARVELPDTTEDEARAKAQTIDAALRMWRRDRGQTDVFTVTMTRWNETGCEISVW